MQVNAVASGYDPILGIVHSERDGSRAFAARRYAQESDGAMRGVLGGAGKTVRAYRSRRRLSSDSRGSDVVSGASIRA